MFLYLATYSDVAIAILRIALGALLVVHGLPKLRALKKSISRSEGFYSAVVAAFVETFGGLALILGFLTQPVALLFVLEFLLILGWRLSKGYRFIGGWEIDLIILAAALFFLAVGAGVYSADASLPWSGY